MVIFNSLISTIQGPNLYHLEAVGHLQTALGAVDERCYVQWHKIEYMLYGLSEQKSISCSFSCLCIEIQNSEPDMK